MIVPLSNIEFHKKQIGLISKIISGIEADREWCDLICSQVEQPFNNMDALLDHRNNYKQSLQSYEQRFIESQSVLTKAGIDWIDYIGLPEKTKKEQIEWEQSLGIKRFTRWQYFLQRLLFKKWKRIN